MEHVLNDTTVSAFAQYARNVWGIQESCDTLAAQKGIDSLRAFYAMLHLPTTLREAGIQETTYFSAMADKALPYLNGTFFPLTKEDILAIYNKSY